jgi:hypothetical protein
MATLNQTRRGGRAAGQNGPAGQSQGTLGGIMQNAMGAKPGARASGLGDAGYLWVLIALEVSAIAWLRTSFKRRHGG